MKATQRNFDILRYNVLTVAAWLDCPDLDIPVQKVARHALRELIRDLHITANDLERRKTQLAIETSQR